MAKKTLLTLYFFEISSYEYLLVLTMFVIISFVSLIFIHNNIRDNINGFAYSANELDNMLQINSWTLPNNVNYKDIIESDIFNYTKFKLIVTDFLENEVLKQTLFFSLIIHLSSSIIPIVALNKILNSEAMFIMRSNTRNKISYSLIITFSSIMLIIPYIVFTVAMYNALLSWLITLDLKIINAYLVIVSLISSSVSTMIYMVSRRESLSYFYGFVIPLLCLLDPKRFDYYFPIGRFLVDNSLIYITPYITLYVLLLIVYWKRGGIL